MFAEQRERCGGRFLHSIGSFVGRDRRGMGVGSGEIGAREMRTLLLVGGKLPFGEMKSVGKKGFLEFVVQMRQGRFEVDLLRFAVENGIRIGSIGFLRCPRRGGGRGRRRGTRFVRRERVAGDLWRRSIDNVLQHGGVTFEIVSSGDDRRILSQLVQTFGSDGFHRSSHQRIRLEDNLELTRIQRIQITIGDTTNTRHAFRSGQQTDLCQ